jgi:type IV pilus assembly protein PilQ
MDTMKSYKLAAALIALTLLAGGAHADEGIATGDFVYVNVHRHPDLSTNTQVDANGAVELPYIGRVDVKGLSDAEASKRVEEAMKAILKSPRVSLTRNANVQTNTPTAGRMEKMQTRMVPLQNSSAEGLFTALSGMSSEGGSVNFEPDTNTLILTDTPSALQEMLAVVEQLDQMKSQVVQIHIETKIAEVENGAMKELGIKWFAQGDNVGGGFNQTPRLDSRVDAARGGYDPLFNEQLSSGDGRNTGAGRRFLDEANWDRRLQIPLAVAAPGQMYLGYLNEGIDLGIMIDALVADNQAELLAAPYIRTVNHQPAQIKMVEEFPYTELGSSGLSTVANVRFIDVGISLDVTPHVRRDPEGNVYVQMEMEPEVSTATGLSNGVPIRSVRSSHSTANVRDGQTLVIGGILQNDVRNVEQKVPGIGNVPVIGRLFKHNERSKASRELMIFVTPTVYDKPENATWDRALNLKEVTDGADFLAGLESRAEQRKD